MRKIVKFHQFLYFIQTKIRVSTSYLLMYLKQTSDLSCNIRFFVLLYENEVTKITCSCLR